MVRRFFLATAFAAVFLPVFGDAALAGPRQVTPAGTSYVPPVDAPVIDPFRPPPHPYGPGNRGLEYGTAPGDAVRASADGVVIFAGQVGGTLHVAIRHQDGLRTSYSFLASTGVRLNDRVGQGDQIGTATGAFHFGVRDPNGTYLDPALLFAGRLRPEVHLVPGPDDGDGHPRSLQSEVAALGAVVRDRLATAAAFGIRVARDTGGAWRLRLHAAANATGAAHLASIARSMQGWYLQRHSCTPADVAAPRPAGRRIAVLVGGIGSSSESAAIDNVDTGAIGYAPGDVVRFSYRGGRTPKPLPPGSALGSVTSSRYESADTEKDLALSADELSRLLAEIAAAQPGVPIDVIAHSQGGVVSRLAVSDSPPSEVETLVTLGTPHNGANLATAIAAARLDQRLATALRAAYISGKAPLDPDGTSAAQLAETSQTVEEMRKSGVPPSVRVRSIGARGDLVVPAPRTIVGNGSASTVVPIDGISAHDQLPGSPAARREIALAVAGRPPTCRSFQQALGDALVSEGIDALEDDLTAAAAWAPVLAA